MARRRCVRPVSVGIVTTVLFLPLFPLRNESFQRFLVYPVADVWSLQDHCLLASDRHYVINIYDVSWSRQSC
jgi:hypothetical protein